MMPKQAQATKAQPSPDKPDYVVRARQDRNSRYFITIGAAWKKKDRNGNDIVSVKLNALPLHNDGSFLLIPPFVDDADAGDD